MIFVPGDTRTTGQWELCGERPTFGPVERPGCRADDVYEDESAALDALLDRVDGRRVALVTDHGVARPHARRLAGRLRGGGVHVQEALLPAGARSRSIGTAISLMEWLAASEVARHDVVVAMGGGVVVEIVGWAANAYLRGVPYCSVPTTLPAQLAPSPGGDTAVGRFGAAPLVDGFQQPMAVLLHVGYLTSPDRQETRGGLAEAIKRGIASSPALFAFVERHHAALLAAEPAVTARLVRRARRVGNPLIARDPCEAGPRRPLDLGDMVRDAVETATGTGPVRPGEAAAFGMVCAARIAVRRGLLPVGTLARLTALLRRVGLPVSLDALATAPKPSAVLAALSAARGACDGRVSFVLPVALGETLITACVSDREIRAALADTPELAPSASGVGHA